MDTAILVDDLDKNAFKLVNSLNRLGYSFTVAALMKNFESNDWKLVLAIPNLHTWGSRDRYSEIYDVIKSENLNLSLSDITLIDDESKTSLLLKKSFSVGSEITKINFREQYVEGVHFPDSIIYKVA